MQKEGLLERKISKDALGYGVTLRGEDAVFILLAFLRYGLKHHPGARVVTAKPSPVSTR